MEFNEEEVETVKKLIYDWGFEYSLKATVKEVAHLKDKVGELEDVYSNIRKNNAEVPKDIYSTLKGQVGELESIEDIYSRKAPAILKFSKAERFDG